MSYKICATKRDVNTVGKPLQYFTPSQWIVRISTGTNAGDYDISDTYLLIKNGEVTSLTCNISFINGCVYEGMQVTVGSGTKLSFGTILQKDIANQCATKLKVLETNCSLIGESATYTSNRLVREEDIVAPSIVTVYYDPRYLIVEEFKTDGIAKFPMASIDPGVPERTPGDELDPLMNREFAYLSILCTKGNKVQVRQKNTVNSDLVLNSVYAYDNLSTPMYELNTPGYEGAEFIASDNCFITFDLVALEYRLSAAAPLIDCGTLWYFSIEATHSDNETDILVNVGTDDPKHPVCRWSEDYIMVANEDLINLLITLDTGNFSHTITSLVLRNLTTNEAITLNLDENNQSLFTMPSSDCQIETTVIVHEDSEDEELEYPIRTLTFIGNLFQTITVNDTVYTVQDGKVENIQLLCGTSPHALALIYYDAGMPAIYHVRAYPSDTGPTSMPRSQVTPHTTLSLSTDMTLEVSYSSISCEYKTVGGLISELTKGESWNSTSNTITNVLPSLGFYKLATLTPITLTPANLAFKNKELLEEVKFHTDNSSFFVLKDSFRECNSLHNVVLPDVSSLSIRNAAFYRCANLSKLELPYGLNSLLTYVFSSNNYRAIYPSNEYTSTLQYEDALIFKVDSEYKSSLSIIPEGTFSTCSRLEEVYLPASITKIESKAFRNCHNLKHFASPGLLIIELGAFEETWVEGTDSSNLLQVSVDKELLYKRYGTSGILFYQFPNSGPGLNDKYTGVTYIVPNPTTLTELILYKLHDKQKGGLKTADGWDFTAHKNTISISDSAFSGKSNINHFIMTNANKLFHIGENAFHSSFVRDVLLPLSTTIDTIGKSAFNNCSRLKSFLVGGSVVKNIGDYAFANCSDLIPPAFDIMLVEHIGDYAFSNSFNAAYKLYKSLSIWSKVIMVASSVIYAFVGEYLATVMLDKAISGGNGDWLRRSRYLLIALMENTGTITGATLGSSYIAMLDLIDNALWKCYEYPINSYLDPNLWGSAVSSGIGLRVSRGVYTLKFPESLLTIGKYAFLECKDIKSLIFLSNIKTITEGCFKNCEFLEKILFAKDELLENGSIGLIESLDNFSVEKIEKEAFYNTSLDSLNINKLIYNANTVEDRAFARCPYIYVNGVNLDVTIEYLNNNCLRTLCLPESLKTVGEYAFAGANIVQFAYRDLSNVNIHEKAFSLLYVDNYNPYLTTMPTVFIVPADMELEYRLFFTNSNIRFAYLATYDYTNGSLIKLTK